MSLHGLLNIIFSLIAVSKHGFNNCMIFFNPDKANGFFPDFNGGLANSLIKASISCYVISQIYLLPI